ncbi:unnamed protein product [Cuscuta campestris]|uniref:Uncharacterized protein n=1 Tax=Cuscuta campestris TaxID=132261 RepID=A0A484NMX5_9ASTE|nr:unnamed protein product [Cuscuta campestris]
MAAQLKNLPTSNPLYLCYPSPFPHRLSRPQFQSPRNPFIPISLSRSLPIESRSQITGPIRRDEDGPVLGDCVVFEEGAFDDPFLHRSIYDPASRRRDSAELAPENLVPEDWADVQREINIAKKKKRKEKQRVELRPIGGDDRSRARADLEEYSRVVKESFKRLNPVVLDDPVFPEAGDEGNCEEREDGSGWSASNGRVKPKNPRGAMSVGDLDDIREFFNNGSYDSRGSTKSGGPFLCPSVFSLTRHV